MPLGDLACPTGQNFGTKCARPGEESAAEAETRVCLGNRTREKHSRAFPAKRILSALGHWEVRCASYSQESGQTQRSTISSDVLYN